MESLRDRIAKSLSDLNDSIDGLMKQREEVKEQLEVANRMCSSSTSGVLLNQNNTVTNNNNTTNIVDTYNNDNDTSDTSDIQFACQDDYTNETVISSARNCPHSSCKKYFTTTSHFNRHISHPTSLSTINISPSTTTTTITPTLTLTSSSNISGNLQQSIGTDNNNKLTITGSNNSTTTPSTSTSTTTTTTNGSRRKSKMYVREDFEIEESSPNTTIPNTTVTTVQKRLYKRKINSSTTTISGKKTKIENKINETASASSSSSSSVNIEETSSRSSLNTTTTNDDNNNIDSNNTNSTQHSSNTGFPSLATSSSSSANDINDSVEPMTFLNDNFNGLKKLKVLELDISKYKRKAIRWKKKLTNYAYDHASPYIRNQMEPFEFLTLNRIAVSMKVVNGRPTGTYHQLTPTTSMEQGIGGSDDACATQGTIKNKSGKGAVKFRHLNRVLYLIGPKWGQKSHHCRTRCRNWGKNKNPYKVSCMQVSRFKIIKGSRKVANVFWKEYRRWFDVAKLDAQVQDEMKRQKTKLKSQDKGYELDGDLSDDEKGGSSNLESIGPKAQVDPGHCDVCDTTFPNSSALSLHRDSAHPDIPRRCSYCNKMQVNREALTIHCNTAHPDKSIPRDPKTGKFPCLQCDKLFVHACDCKRHVRLIHENPQPLPITKPKQEKPPKKQKQPKQEKPPKKPHICDSCQYEFITKGGLQGHQRAGEKCTKCEVICYTSRCSFDHHLKYHPFTL